MIRGKSAAIAVAFLLALGFGSRAQGEALYVDAADDGGASGEVVPLAVTATVDLNYGPGWSLISLPVTPDDGTVTTLFPDAISAFEFSGGYAQVTTLSPCAGYWLNLQNGGTYQVTGTAVAECADTFGSGWSLMGVPLGGTAVADIAQDPTDNIISVFGFSGGYAQATALSEGSGYWVNLQSSGTLTLTGATGSGKVVADIRREVALTESKLVAVSGDQEQTLYLGAAAEGLVALPPLPPSGALDARVEVAGMSAQGAPASSRPMDYRMRVQGESVELRWEMDASDAGRWQLLVDGTEYRLEGTGSVRLTGTPDLWLRYTPSTPSQYALRANYPNPFNPSTTIRYELAGVSQVRLSVYDVLGQRVRTLVDMQQSGGTYSVVWDGLNDHGQQVANGIYFYELQAGDYHSIRKMMLAK